MDGSGIAGLKDTRVRGVRRLPTGSLLVRASSEEQADLLFRHDGAWLPHLRSLRGARVERKSYMLIASSVPTDFDPSAPSAAELLWLENSGTVATKGAIRDLRWLHAGRSQSSLKREGSLVFSVADATAADQLIYSSLSVRGALCSVSKFVPPLCSASAANNSAMWPRRARRPPLLLLFVAHAVQALTLCATACAPLRPSAPMPDTAPTLRFGVQTVKDRISPLTVSVQSRHSNRVRSPRASITAHVITAHPSTRLRPVRDARWSDDECSP